MKFYLGALSTKDMLYSNINWARQRAPYPSSHFYTCKYCSNDLHVPFKIFINARILKYKKQWKLELLATYQQVKMGQEKARDAMKLYEQGPATRC